MPYRPIYIISYYTATIISPYFSCLVFSLKIILKIIILNTTCDMLMTGADENELLQAQNILIRHCGETLFQIIIFYLFYFQNTLCLHFFNILNRDII